MRIAKSLILAGVLLVATVVPAHAWVNTCSATVPCGYGRFVSCSVYPGVNAWGQVVAPCAAWVGFGSVTCTGADNWGRWGTWTFTCY